MKKGQTLVTDAELAVLNVLWDIGPRTIGEIAGRLYPKKTTAEYATVQKLLDRLERKGCVARNRTGHAHVFAASIDRDRVIGEHLQDLADRLCDGSLTPLLLHFVRRTRLTDRDRVMLRRLIDEAE